MRLQKKVAIVTGAARGQGEAVARRFAREGARVVVADREAKGVETVAADIRKRGETAVAVTADVTVAEEVATMVETARREYGALHVLYNNAGIYLTHEDAPTADLPPPVFDRITDVNLRGVYLCCHYAIPLLLESGNGVILTDQWHRMLGIPWHMLTPLLKEGCWPTLGLLRTTTGRRACVPMSFVRGLLRLR